MQCETSTCHQKACARVGRAALSALVGIVFLSVIAASAAYFVLQRPDAAKTNDAMKKDGETLSPEAEPSPPSAAAAQAVDQNMLEQATPAAESAGVERADAPVIDPEQQERLTRVAAIKAGSWTTRRIVALTAVGPYVIDFRTGIEGKSLEEAERENLNAIADQLLAPPRLDTDEMASADAASGDGTSDAEMGEAPQVMPMQGSEKMSMATPSASEGSRVDAVPDVSDAEKPPELEIAWEELLQRPLVAAGWLGNLIAEDEQRDQLISMYDKKRDDMVSRDELRDFLSRGLSRRSSVQLADIGNSPDARDASPWGPFDLNEDYVLDENETSKVLERFKDLDTDGDDAITLAEVRTSSMQAAAMAQSPMVLAAKTLYILDPVDSDTSELEQLRKFGNLAARVIEHYTFLAELPSDKWPGYPARRWREMDKDESGGIDRYEMRRLFQLPADINIFLRFDPNYDSGFAVHAELNAPDATDLVGAEQSEHAELPTEAVPPDREFEWLATPAGGRLYVDGLALQINVEDLFSATNLNLVVGQIESAIKNKPIAENLRTAFQLGEDAFELVDQDGDGELDPEETDRLWQWLTARQSTRIAGRWMLAPEPWFQLLDRSGDGSISETEVTWLLERFEAMFGGGEANLGAGDPLLAQFTIRRADPRLENNPAMATPDPGDNQPAAPLDWFAAMDLNSDGSIDEAEFLGDISDFAELDVNKDGFLRRSELYVP